MRFRFNFHPAIKYDYKKMHIHVSGGFRISQTGKGRQPQTGRGHQLIILANYSRKLHGNLEKWTKGGAGGSYLANPLDPPMINDRKTL